MHGTSLPAITPGLFLKKFSHQRLQVPPFGDIMALPTVSAENIVISVQRGTDSHGHGFLPDGEMVESLDPSPVQLDELFLDRAAEKHLSVHGNPCIFGDLIHCLTS